MIPARAHLPIPTAADLVGSYRRFGDFGPVYQVQRVEAELPDGDALLHLLVPETSEEVDIPYSIVLRHPEADLRGGLRPRRQGHGRQPPEG